MAITLPDARLLSDEILEALRLRAVRGCTLGYTEAQMAELLGVARETVCRGCGAYQAGAEEALPQERSGRPPGSGRLLSETQAQHVQAVRDQQTPADRGIAAPLWSRRAVQEWRRREFGLRLAVGTVGAYWPRWGYPAKRPRRHSTKQDPDEVQDWLQHTYPLIERLAADLGASIHWCDETGVAADEHAGVGYARIGQPAPVAVPDEPVRVNQISTITNTGAVHVMTYTGTLTAALVVTFLERWLRRTAASLIGSADRRPAHAAQTVEVWMAPQSRL
jgi:transposase